MTIRGPITRAVAEALKDAELLPRDAAAVALVKQYAKLLDHESAAPELVADLGPKLLHALSALAMTPAGRSAKGGVTGGSPVASKLDELLERRARRGAG